MRPLPTRITPARRVALAMALPLLLLLQPATASAAGCTTQQRADLDAATTITTRLVARAAPGHVDAVNVLARARRKCSTAKFARAVATLTARHGVPRGGRNWVWRGLVLAGRPGAAAAPNVYRLDTARMAAQALTPRSEAARARSLAALRTWASPGRRTLLWSPDPTKRTLDPALQARTALVLSRSRDAAARRDARATLARLGRDDARNAAAMLPLVAGLQVAVETARASRATGDAGSASVARAMAVRQQSRVRRTPSSGWSRVDGEWSSLRTHRVLVSRSRALLALQPNARTATATSRLARMLTADPEVRFVRVPSSPFYPVPRDGSLDTDEVVVTVDKPGTAVLRVYDPLGGLVRTHEQRILPGTITVAWDGNDQEGTAVAPGSYRYGLRIVDRAGNRRNVAGLRVFAVKRDTVAPTISAARTVHVSGRTRRVLRVTWTAHEAVSPGVTVQLRIRGGALARPRAITLRDAALTGTRQVTTRLAKGRYFTSVVVLDGAGNRSARESGRLQLP